MKINTDKLKECNEVLRDVAFKSVRLPLKLSSTFFPQLKDSNEIKEKIVDVMEDISNKIK